MGHQCALPWQNIPLKFGPAFQTCMNEPLLDSYLSALALAKRLRMDSADAQVLLSERLKVSRASIIAFPERSMSAVQSAQIQSDFAARARGVPVAYLLGRREFFGLELTVNAAVLIPRADTETLIEVGLELFPITAKIRALDLGTGSGAIALALKSERSHWQVFASDQSAAALSVAQGNAQRLGLQVHFALGNWFAPWQAQQFDLICANPPYIADQDPHVQQGDLRFEPIMALTSGVDGLRDLRRIIEGARTALAPDGWLVLEHGYDQAKPVRELLEHAGFRTIQCRQDLAGHDRVSFARQAIRQTII
jgi:release factor glutamine methyltransferase